MSVCVCVCECECVCVCVCVCVRARARSSESENGHLLSKDRNSMSSSGRDYFSLAPVLN